MEVPGGYGKAFSKRIHDPCKVRAAVFDDGKSASRSSGSMRSSCRGTWCSRRARRSRSAAALPGTGVMIGASHSHSSGPIGMVMPGDFDHASDLVKDLAYNKSSCADAAYMTRRCATRSSRRWSRRMRARAEATAGFGTGREETVAFNRRIRMKNGLELFAPRQRQPGQRRLRRADRPAGRRDRRVECRTASCSAAWSTSPATPRRAARGFRRELDLLHGARDPGLLRRGREGRLPARRVRRRDAGGQSRSARESRTATRGRNSSAGASARRR